ncbi:trithorax group protein osa-like isoform X12 [Nilaparvata lugens]|nr:trithorax group protein osa-like isoform X12 [Nilaparvata lugens]
MRPTPSPTGSTGSRSMSPAVGQQNIPMPPRPPSSQSDGGGPARISHSPIAASQGVYQQQLAPPGGHMHNYKMGPGGGGGPMVGQQMAPGSPYGAAGQQQYPPPPPPQQGAGGAQGYPGSPRPPMQYGGPPPPNQSYGPQGSGPPNSQYPPSRGILNHVSHSQFGGYQGWGSPQGPPPGPPMMGPHPGAGNNHVAAGGGKGGPGPQPTGPSGPSGPPPGPQTPPQPSNASPRSHTPPHYLKQHLQHKVGLSGAGGMPPSPGGGYPSNAGGPMPPHHHGGPMGPPPQHMGMGPPPPSSMGPPPPNSHHDQPMPPPASTPSGGPLPPHSPHMADMHDNGITTTASGTVMTSVSGSQTTGGSVTSVVTTGPDGTPMDEASQQSTLSNASAASGGGEDGGSSGGGGGKSRGGNKDSSMLYHHPHPSPVSGPPSAPGPPGPPGPPGASMHDNDYPPDNSPTWSRTPSSPVFNSHVPQDLYRTKQKHDSLGKLYEMDESVERRVWLDKLLQFMDERGTPISACPTISKNPLDLFRLYLYVKERGGFMEVCKVQCSSMVAKNKIWKDIAGLLGIGASSSAAYTLRKHYTKNLLPFECHFDRGGIDPQPIINQVESSTKKKGSKANPVPSPGTSSSNSQDSFPAGGGGPGSGSMDGYNYGYPQDYNNQRPPSQSNQGSGGSVTGGAAPDISVSNPFEDMLTNANSSLPPPLRGRHPHVPPGMLGGYQNQGGYSQYPDQYNQQYPGGPAPGGGNYPPNRPMYPPAPYGAPEAERGYSQGGASSGGQGPAGQGGQPGGGQDPYRGYQPGYPPRPGGYPPQGGPGPGQGGAGAPPGGNAPSPQADYYNSSAGGPSKCMPPPPPSNQPRRHPDFASKPPDQPPGPPPPGQPPYPPSPYNQQRPPAIYGGQGGWSSTNNNQYRGPGGQFASQPPSGAGGGGQWGGGGPPRPGPPPGPQQQPPPPGSQWADQHRYPPNSQPPFQSPQQWGSVNNMSNSMGPNAAMRPQLGPRANFRPDGKQFGQMPGAPGMKGQGVGVQAGTKREMVFPPESVEATTPVLYKRRRLTKGDVAPVDAWRLMMALRSGLLAETCWALDVLNILLFDDNAVAYFGLSHLPGLLDILLEHFRRALADMLEPNSTDEQPPVVAAAASTATSEKHQQWYERCVQSSADVDLGQVEKPPDPTDRTPLVACGEHTLRTHRGVAVSVVPASDDIFVLDSKRAWDTDAEFIMPEDGGCDLHTSLSYIVPCFRSDFGIVPFVRLLKTTKVTSNCDRRTNECTTTVKVKKEEEEEKGESSEVDDSSVKKEVKDDSEISEKDKDPALSKRIRDPAGTLKQRKMSDYEDECYSRDEASLSTVTESQDSIARRCICLSNILRNLTFVPGNELEFAKNSTLLGLLGKLLLLHHEHPLRTLKQRNYDREEDADFGDCCSSLQGDTEWWWEWLLVLRENALVCVANIAGHIDLEPICEEVSRPLLDGLLHWAVCPAAQGQDPFPSVAPSSPLSPQRLALEALVKLCVTDSNVDLVIATPPFSRLERLCSVLTRLLCRIEEQVLREFAVNLLHYLAAADSGMARTIALQSPVVSLLVAFIEQAEASALGVANQHGIAALRDNPDCMGTSLDMLRRAARTLLHLAKHPDNRPLFLQQEQRLLALVMSQILDQQVAALISRVLFHCSRPPS